MSTAFDQFRDLSFPNHYRKLKYLSADNQNFIKQGIVLYQESYLLFGNFRFKTREEYKKEMDAALVMAREEGDFSSLKELVKLHTGELKQANSLEWYCFYNKNLQQEEVWDRYKEQANENQKLVIEKLHTQWKFHAKFSHYTSDALLYSAEILDELAFHLAAAKLEFTKNKKRMSKLDAENYSVYLDNFLQEIIYERTLICQAMYARWKLVCQKGDVTQDDVTVHLVTQLNQLGVTADSRISKRQRSVQAPVHNYALFVKFHGYIAKQGSEVIKNLMQQSLKIPSATGDQAEIIIVPIERSGHEFLVPLQLASQIPQQVRKPRWLFKEQNFRYQFFYDKSELLIRMSFLTKLKIDAIQLQNLSNDPNWQELQALRELLKVEIASAESQVRKFGFSYFWKKSNKFLAQWQGMLLQQQEVVIKYQIDFLENFVKKVNPLSHLFEEPAFNENAMQEIKLLISQIEPVLPNFEVDRFQQAVKIISDLFNKDKLFKIQNGKLKDICHVFIRLKEKQSIYPEDFKIITQYYFELSFSKRKDFISKNYDLIESLADIVIDFFRAQPEYLEELHSVELIMLTEQCAKLLWQYADKTLKDRLNQSIFEFFEKHKNYLVRNQVGLQANHKLLLHFENILERLMPRDLVGQISHFKIAREHLMAGKSPACLEILFSSSAEIVMDNIDSFVDEDLQKILADRLQLEKRLNDAQLIHAQIQAMPSVSPLPSDFPKTSIVAVSDQSSSSIDNVNTETSALTPELLAFCQKMAIATTEKIEEIFKNKITDNKENTHAKH